jgi:hypothetical protein
MLHALMCEGEHEAPVEIKIMSCKFAKRVASSIFLIKKEKREEATPQKALPQA